MTMKLDLWLNNQLLATDLPLAVAADVCKLDAGDVAWALEGHGVCSTFDVSGRELTLVAHGDGLPAEVNGPEKARPGEVN
jgi:hypothetical protein